MIYLSLSVLFSSLIYVVFTWLGKKQVNLLPALVVNYITAACCAFIFSDYTAVTTMPWWPIAVALGALFICIFFVMARTTQTFGLATASVASKMSMIIPVVLAIYLLNESITLIKVLGLLCGMMAVLLISYQKKSKSGELKKAWLPIVLFFGSGIIDSSLKYCEYQYFPDGPNGLFIACLFACAGIFGWILNQTIIKDRFSKKALMGGLVLGIVNYGSIYFILKSLGLKHLEASIIFPINNVGIVGFSTLLGWAIYKQKLNIRSALGLALAFCAIGLLAW